MAIYRILVTNLEQSHQELILEEGELVIGRSSRADIVLSEDSVSRRHARLYIVEDGLHIEDLGSSNGVIRNGKRETHFQITPQDIVQIGCYTLRATPAEEKLRQKLTRRTEIQYGEVAPLHEQIVKSDHTSVSFLYQVSQCLCTHRKLGPLLEGVLNAVMDSVPAERAYILARRNTLDPLKLAASRVRRPQAVEPPLSHTLIDHVVSTRASVMTSDASQDERFEESASIAEYKIKAVICVPLSGHDGVFGTLYVGSDSMSRPLTQEHLQLLSIVGQIVGAGLQNIVLNEKQARQERLAGIGETVSRTSHDMRNIMMGISGGTEMVEYGCESESWSQAREGARILRKTLGRLKKLADGMLDYARVSELRLEETDLSALVDEVLGTISTEAKRRLIDIRFQHAAAGNVYVDSQQLYRVLLNLVHNAMDAIDEKGGTIEIESGSEDGATFLRVRDTGHGISPEHLEQIGRPFFTTKEDRGNGLGLATCYRIMEQHKGSIDVNSELEKGTTFTLLFPADNSATRHD